MKNRLAIFAVLALVVGLPVLLIRSPDVQGQANVPIYIEQGGATQVIGSGGKIDVQSGATLEVDSGATLTVGGSQLAAGSVILTNGTVLNDTALGTAKLSRSTSGTLTLTTADDDATAALTINPGGNTTLTLGSASDTVSLAATSGLTLSNSETLSNGTDAAFTLGRNDSGTVTLTAADDDATAALSVLPGGAAAMTLGGASTTAITLTTDGTGSAEVVLPTGAVATGEVLDATLLPADDAYPGRGQFTVCGDATTVNNNTIYYGPSMVVVSSATAGLGRKCDTTAAGNATEGTADELAYTAKAFQILSMDCTHPDANAALTFTARTATGATVPSVTCSDADNDLGCVANIQTTTAIASGAVFDVAVNSTGDIGTVPFVCVVNVAF